MALTSHLSSANGLESIEASASSEVVNRAVEEIRALRNQLAHRASSQKMPRASRQAYRVEEDQLLVLTSCL